MPHFIELREAFAASTRGHYPQPQEAPITNDDRTGHRRREPDPHVPQTLFGKSRSLGEKLDASPFPLERFAPQDDGFDRSVDPSMPQSLTYSARGPLQFYSLFCAGLGFLLLSPRVDWMSLPEVGPHGA